MTTEEIKQAVDAGQIVYWASMLYTVVKDKNNEYLIMCSSNKHAIGLTWADGVTLNGKPEQFYTHTS